jgi:LmbE family N-acetylglucosaminyl deacetylase
MNTSPRFKKILTFFAHPDDETLAAGATLRKLSSEGSEIFVAIPNTGINARRGISESDRGMLLQELRRDTALALQRLGISEKNVFLGEFSDNEIDRHTLLELIHWIEPLIEQIRPDLILTHHRYCTNIDHQYCHEAIVVATRPGINSHIPVLCGEVPSSTGYLKPVQWEPNYYVEVSKEEVTAKIQAMMSYKGEARPDPHPRSPEVLEALAKVRGSESGFFFAEAFMINKMFFT